MIEWSALLKCDGYRGRYAVRWLEQDSYHRRFNDMCSDSLLHHDDCHVKEGGKIGGRKVITDETVTKRGAVER
jgi:hypothetical protein